METFGLKQKMVWLGVESSVITITNTYLYMYTYIYVYAVPHVDVLRNNIILSSGLPPSYLTP